MSDVLCPYCGWTDGTCPHALQIRRIEGLEAELAALRADAERYRWLRDKATWYHCYITNTMTLKERFSADIDGLDAAIDTARKEAP